MTDTLRIKFQKVGIQSHLKNPLIVVRYYNEQGKEVFLATEYDEKLRLFYGYVDYGNGGEMKQFTLELLECIARLHNLKRDMWFGEKYLNDFIK